MAASRCKIIITTTSFFLVLYFSFQLPGLAASQAEQPEMVEVKIGVLAKRGASFCKKQWSPTVAYLSAQISGHSFTLVPLSFEEIVPAVSKQEIDFILSNSAIFAGLEVVHGTSCVVTMVNLFHQQGVNAFGGVIFYKAGRKDIRFFDDLKGKTFMGVDRHSFGGWITALRELKTHDIDPDHDFRTLQFSGTHDAVVNAVLAGKVDAGVVRTDTLERMASENKISLSDIEVIPLNHDHDLHLHADLIGHTIYETFPNLHSTHLYPEWPFAKLNHTPLDLAKKVAMALYAMPPTSEAAQAANIAGWTIPQQYQSVRECLQDLKVWPYEDLGKIYLSDILKKYWFLLLTVALAFSAILFTSLYIARINRALTLSKQRLKHSYDKQEASFDKIIEESINELYIFDATTLNFLRVNQGAQRNLGYSSQELNKMTTVDIKPEFNLEAYLEKMQPLISGQEKHLIFETVHQRKDGSTYPVEIHLQPASYHGHKVYVAMSLDITERKIAESEKNNLEENLKQAQKMEAIGLMAGGVAHDLNNILSGIVGYPELILHDLPADNKLRKPIEAIQDSGSRAAAVVADLLTVARGVASTRELQDLNSLAQEYLNSPEYKKNISLYQQITYQQKLTAAHPYILCSSVHVKKCLMNLVINASEAVDAAGMIVISTENQTIANAEAARYHIEPGEYVVLNVSDNGHGIKDIDLERIFEPFYTKKVMGRSGTGLGLSIVWNTMRDHDGVVLVESSTRGTSFQLFFPMSEEKKITKTDSDVTEDIIGNGEHILLVDDEPILRDIGCQILETLGYVVDSVSSGELAVEFVQKTPVDLIVLDMLMEPGMNGLQTYEKIKKIYPGQKAIIVSGFSESNDAKKALLLGVDRFIKKPYAINQLGQAVKGTLNK